MKHQKCCIDGCDGGGSRCNGRVCFTRGFCKRHYAIFLKYGDANYPIKLQAKPSGRKNNPLYVLYKGIVARTGRKSAYNFNNYGGRGVCLCDRWSGIGGFDNFCEDMGERPSLKHSIDRIDNNGHYCKENCRWATYHQQASNKRNVNHVGVYYIYNKDKYRSRLQVKDKIYTKYSNTLEEAIEKRKELELKYLTR